MKNIFCFFFNYYKKNKYFQKKNDIIYVLENKLKYVQNDHCEEIVAVVDVPTEPIIFSQQHLRLNVWRRRCLKFAPLTFSKSSIISVVGHWEWHLFICILIDPRTLSHCLLLRGFLLSLSFSTCCPLFYLFLPI